VRGASCHLLLLLMLVLVLDARLLLPWGAARRAMCAAARGAAACQACAQHRHPRRSPARRRYAFIYHLFGLLWTNQFIVGFACVVIANAVANFYWHRCAPLLGRAARQSAPFPTCSPATAAHLAARTCHRASPTTPAPAPRRGDHNAMPTFPVISAMRNTTFYHLGSIAFGAFIIAVVQFIRIVLEYINRKTQQLQQNNEVRALRRCELPARPTWHPAPPPLLTTAPPTPPQMARWAMCCLRCCMWCVETVLKFINRNAYILVASKGMSYCTAAGEAVALIVKNALRLLAVNLVGDSLIWLGKLGVAAGGGVVAFLMANSRCGWGAGGAGGAGCSCGWGRGLGDPVVLSAGGGGQAACARCRRALLPRPGLPQRPPPPPTRPADPPPCLAPRPSPRSYYNDAAKYPDTYLSSAVLPIALAVGIAFIVAEIFFAVYEMAVDTILLSFCEDCEANRGQPRYAPPLLLETLGDPPPQ
jgi:hypothetical protein